ncbi:MAG: HD-GYP domain-containing protein [Lachnospiraceae bacterium]|nr:HD-GYP domain-containing protein [Lachnospiraceae bacterium]
MTKQDNTAGELSKLIEKVRNTGAYCHFNEAVMQSAKLLENSLSSFITNIDEDLTSNDLLNQTKEIIVMSENPLHTFHVLHKIRKYDDATFIHSLNVAILCNLYGQWTNMPQEECDVLTLAGLLHDVGKMKIPEEIIKKPGSLTEEEFNEVKNHPRRGYLLLESLHIDDRIKKAALQHHERCDGSGYPDGLVSEQIDDFAKIVAIADIYDALTSARVYRGPLCPFAVIDMIEKDNQQKKFDSRFLIPFLTGIVRSFIGCEVLLSDGRKAKILKENTDQFAKPIVQIGQEQIDLQNEKECVIQSLI